MKASRLLLVIIIAFFAIISNGYCYLENVHKRISVTAIDKNFSQIDLLLKQVGVDGGLNGSINNYALRDWILEGSGKEDEFPRYLNHFYSPLNGSGLNDYFSGQPSFEWAADWGNEWSWRVARNRYHLGLTSTTDTERRAALADSFRALGQNMHLVQDLAAPAHVRNDAHPRGDGFEAYTSENVNSLNFVPIAFSGPKNSVSASAPRQLWNSDQYDGTNPSNSTAIGLAEYTNANFASEDTIFTENNLNDWIPLNENHYFPFPRQEDTIVFAESQNRTLNGFAVYRKYFDKVGGGQTIRHFATASRLYAYLLDDPEPSIQGFDDQCYKDYADLLIPRAVGYSAALLDYFFRGEIDMTADSSGQYVIKNESDEAMSGTFSLYYDDKYDMRKLVPAAEWNLSIAAKGASSPVTFTAPSDAKEPGKYMLVFLGTHGAESGAVAGKEVTLQSKDGVIKIRLTGPDGGQIKRDIIFNVWAKRKDTGMLCKISAISWKYDDAAGYWEVTVPSLSDAIEYNATYNRYDTVTPVGGFDLAQGVYLDYLWKAASVGVLPSTYTGKGYYGSTYHEEETRNLAQNPISLGLKIGYKPNTQPIPGIEILSIFPKDNYNNYSIQLDYDAAKKQIDLAGGTRLVVAANDEGVYGLSQKGYSSMIIKVSPSALPATNYSAEFSINSGRLDKSKIIKTGSVWTQYPGKYRTDQRYLPASKLDLKQNGVFEDVIPYIYTEQTSDVSALYMNSMQVSSIELNSNMEYSINYNGVFYGALWRNLDVPSEIGLGVEGEGYCWTICRGDSSYVLWDNVNGKCGGSPRYNPLSWVPSGSTAWVDTDIGTYSLFPVSLIQYKNFEFTPGTRTHYIAGNSSIPSTLTVSSGTKTTDYSLQEQYPRIFKILNGPKILLRD